MSLSSSPSSSVPGVARQAVAWPAPGGADAPRERPDEPGVERHTLARRRSLELALEAVVEPQRDPRRKAVLGRHSFRLCGLCRDVDQLRVGPREPDLDMPIGWAPR